MVVHVQVLSETPNLVRGLKAEESKTDPTKVMAVSMGWEQEAAAHCTHVWLLQSTRALGPAPWESLLASVSFQ